MPCSEPSSSSRGSRPPSAWPSAHATAALVVAMAVAPASCQRRALAASQALGSSSGTSVSCRATNWAWGESVMAGSVYSVGRGYAPDASHAWVKYQVGCGDRKSVVSGKSVSVRVDLGGRRIIKKKKKQKQVLELTAYSYTINI